MNPTEHYPLLFLVALLATLLATPLAKCIAQHLGAIDKPDERRINKVPIPRMGGIGIALGLVAAVAVQVAGTKLLGWPTVFVPHMQLQGVDYKLLTVAVVIVFLTGAIDDVRNLKPRQKLLGQILAACVAAASGLVIGNVANPFTAELIPIGWLAYPITVVYLVAFTNVINLIDGLDGLAAGITAISCAAMFYLSYEAHQIDAAVLACILAGCCLGFLRYNFNPASIFMGDCGSNMLGFLLGVIALLGVNRVAAATTLIVPLVIAGVPIIDTFAAIVRRRRGHTAISQADTGHIQHRLIKQGFDQRQAALMIYGWSILLAAGAIIMTKVALPLRFVVFILLVSVSAVFIRKLHLFKPVLLHRYNPKTHTDEIVSAEQVEEESASK
ncbi:MAG: undecaprenyl/decaprenyl-phosphate alpha-N-acetylglucosaminyl 1-phosphate transferase [Coriobacteriaceae bacterium]|nr:undecaprenyl/decaprenyl-phosphate alpha-N-acetylglucosaminyl 1-phosphate transferase [Coriobacteriaceae bacterium]MDD7111260.1 MraY family glycosyltransferase [Coriobacteriaceae bacterium]MDY5808783.1 MraY family glycosyltransferase [Coriobacteriales bacterium]